MNFPRRLALAFLAPTAVLLLVFLAVPAAWSLGLSFTNFTLLGPEALDTRFVGLRNYLLAIYDPYFWNALTVSLLYVLGSALFGQVVLGLALALLIRRAGPLSTLLRNLAVIAWITPAVVVAILWNVYLSGQGGSLNQMTGMDVDWLLRYPLLSIIVFNTWRGAAFSMLLFDAALRSIPDSYYEAAAVCGATRWRQFLDVTLPMLKPQLITDLLLITLWSLNDFAPYLLTGGGPSFATEVLPIYTYRVAFRSFDLGYGAALSTLLLLVNLVLATVYLKVGKK